MFSKRALETGKVVPIDKPADWTSFDVVNKLRYATKVKKVGHSGTLDPFATGLLLVCFGKATKRVESLMALPKEYIGTIAFGASTDTDDITGKIIEEYETNPLDRAEIERVLEKFRGEILQIPPMFAAIKIKGKRLYEIAREGRRIQRDPRKVTIHELTLLELRGGEIDIRVRCSKGAYIRALARDVGEALNCGGYLKQLRRTRIGDYGVDDALTIDEFIKRLVD